MIAKIEDLQASSDHLNIESPFSLDLHLGDVVTILSQDTLSVNDFMTVLRGRGVNFSGKIEIKGHDISEKDTYLYYNWVPTVSEDNLISLTVEQYLNFSAELYGIDLHYRPYLINESLILTNTQEYRDSVIGAVKDVFILKKIELARALVSNPYVIFIEDLFQGAYEDKRKSDIVQILQNIRNTGCSLVVGVDSLEFIKNITSKIIFFVDNTIFLSGEFKDLQQELDKYKLVQIQLLEDSLNNMLDILEAKDNIWEIWQHEDDPGVLKFIFRGEDKDLTDLLQEAVNKKCGIVSCYSLDKFWGRY